MSAVSCERRIVDGAIERHAAGADPTTAFVESVKALRRGHTPGQLERAARLWVRVQRRVDRRGRVLPTRDAGGRFKAVQ